MTYKQMTHWAVCQRCSRTIQRGTEEHTLYWLDHPDSRDDQRRLVRCPLHITNDSLRWTIGRSTSNRKWMARAKRWGKATLSADPRIEPFPLVDKTIEVIMEDTMDQLLDDLPHL